jgi:7-carboxy-7-deazaguanine synthase
VDRADFDYARDFVRSRLSGRLPGVFFQPAWGQLDPAQLVAWLNAEPLPGVRLSLQLHKFIWGPDTTGV